MSLCYSYKRQSVIDYNMLPSTIRSYKQHIASVALTEFCLALALRCLISLPIAHAITFPDIPITHPNAAAINYLAEKGIIQGYEDGLFRPSKEVSRAELLKILIKGTRGIDTVYNPYEGCFLDVPGHEWYALYVCYAMYRNWVSGYDDGLFRPHNTVNKVEALKIIFKSKNILTPNSITVSPYPDIGIDTWYAPYVDIAKDLGLLTPMAHFNPTNGMDRGSVSEMIARLISSELKDGRIISTPVPFADDLIAIFANDRVAAEKGTRVHLDASPSMVHGQVTFQWYTLKTPTPDVYLEFSNPKAPSFIADRVGDYRFRLVIIDEAGRKSAPADVFVTVTGAIGGRELWSLYPDQYLAEIELEVLEMVNQSRREYGLRDLILDPNVSNVARAHSVDQAKSFGTASHSGGDGSRPIDRIKRGGISVKALGENVGWCTNNFQDIIMALEAIHIGMIMEDPDPGPDPKDGNHRTTILSKYYDFTHVGIGVYVDQEKNEIYVTSEFVIFKN